MDEIIEGVLSQICNVTKHTGDGYAVCVTLGVRSDSRKKVCSWLENNGYITKVTYIGQDKVQCQITEKTRKYFKNITNE